MPRAWPIPVSDQAFHCIGDIHLTGMSERRQATLRDDLLRPSVPSVGTHLQLGDMTNNATVEEDAAAVAFLDSIGGDWWAVVGNHDIFGPRTPVAAAAAWGMPGANYTVDLGYAVLVCLAWQSGGGVDDEWLNTTLLANAGRSCLVAAHAPLFETVGKAGIPEGEWSSTDAGFYVANDSETRTVLADNPNARAWLSGHTHSVLSAPDIVKREQVLPGAHYLAHVSTSSPVYTAKTAAWTDQCATPYITVLDDAIEVRFRDHGAHQWVGSGPDLIKAWSVAA